MDKSTVETLLRKAVLANDGSQAMQFAQAACNAANALRVLVDIEQAIIRNAPREIAPTLTSGDPQR